MTSERDPKKTSGVPLKVRARDLDTDAAASARMIAFAGLTPEAVAATIRDAEINTEKDQKRLAAVWEAQALVDSTCVEVRVRIARFAPSAAVEATLEAAIMDLQDLFARGAVSEVRAAAERLIALARQLLGDEGSA